MIKNKRAKSRICTSNFFSKNRKAAMELTMGTMVTIVLVVSVLILGLILIQQIFTGATDSVDTINDKVMNEINNLFGDESASVIVKLGSDKKATIKSNTDDFGVLIGASTYDGSASSRERLEYMITLDDTSTNNCITQLGESTTLALFKQKTETWLKFDEYDGANSYAIVSFTVPKGTATCSQKIYIDVRDNEQGSETMAGTSFIVEIEKGLLG